MVGGRRRIASRVVVLVEVLQQGVCRVRPVRRAGPAFGTTCVLGWFIAVYPVLSKKIARGNRDVALTWKYITLFSYSLFLAHSFEFSVSLFAELPDDRSCPTPVTVESVADGASLSLYLAPFLEFSLSRSCVRVLSLSLR
ncbi:hypothetical protein CsSME_00028004 [Camellia sinensis var. sinensis]